MAFDCIKIIFPHFEDKNKWHNHQVPFVSNYFEIIKSKIHDIKTSHFLVIASYMDFDDSIYDYVPEQFEQNQIHVFYSGENKEGNVMLIPKQKFIEQMDKIKFLLSGLWVFLQPIIKILLSTYGPILIKAATSAVEAMAKTNLPGEQKKDEAFKAIEGALIKEGITATTSVINMVIELAVAKLNSDQ